MHTSRLRPQAKAFFFTAVPGHSCVTAAPHIVSVATPRVVRCWSPRWAYGAPRARVNAGGPSSDAWLKMSRVRGAEDLAGSFYRARTARRSRLASRSSWQPSPTLALRMAGVPISPVGDDCASRCVPELTRFKTYVFQVATVGFLRGDLLCEEKSTRRPAHPRSAEEKKLRSKDIAPLQHIVPQRKPHCGELSDN